MVSITVRADDGSLVEQRVVSKELLIETEPDTEGAGFILDPAVVQRIEYDHKGITSSITTACGETENRRESNEKPDMTIEGVFVYDQLDDAKLLKKGDEVRVTSDVHSGRVFVRRLTIEQNNEIVKIETNETDGRQLAFPFQLQLKQPE